MNKLTKGALSMVLVGSITFSVTNALLADHSSMLSTQGNTFINSGHHKTANGSNQAEKIVKDQTPTTDVKDVQTTLPDNHSAPQAVSKNENKSNQDINVNEKNTTTIRTASPTVNTTATATNTAPVNSIAPITNTAPATGIVPVTNPAPAMKIAVTTSTTSKSNSTSTGASSTKSAAATAPTTTTTTTNNHGQQVSQAAKEKAAGRKE
ncbi:hypothetical protein [Bacillus sp. EB600]|uniref:hypothetical protein n=1 Tax=Bacillus sp. EB600 TaxID=2806345 RepID=UPI00210EE4CC|nr:hypothetical protein [Bacillus sp. EB600]MCQ6280098.1 hypothetical protein [Bacillus sp. EB600]